RDRRRQGEGPGVQGLADDHALYAGWFEGGELAQVVELGNAAAGDDRLVGTLADLQQQRDVGPGEGAVAQHVGHHVPGAPGALQPVEDIDQVAAVAGPAARREGVPAHVEPDRHPLAVRGTRVVAPVRVLQRGGAQVDPGSTGAERPVQRLVVTDAAGQLNRDVE